jgi:hypothetical protein
MQLLRDNLTFWQNDLDNVQQDAGDDEDEGAAAASKGDAAPAAATAVGADESK